MRQALSGFSSLSATLTAAVLSATILTGCAGVGVAASDSPQTKLDNASNLLHNQNRPVIAERLIKESIDIAQSTQNTKDLGDAYFAYGDFLYSSAVTNMGAYYLKNGFQNPTVTMDNRSAKAQEYYAKAIPVYQQYTDTALTNKEYSIAVNGYYQMVRVADKMNDDPAVCRYLDGAISADRADVQAYPNAKRVAPSGYDSLESFLNAVKQGKSC